MYKHVRAFAILIIIRNVLSYSSSIYNGTTPSLEHVIKGRCIEYQFVDSLHKDASLNVNVNCSTDVWNTFRDAFAYKDPCTIKNRDYQKLFEKIQNRKLLVNKAMLWSGTRSVVHDFTAVNDNFVTLEDSFTGYIANDLYWCGCVNCQGGINYQVCNTTCNGAMKSYWDLASQHFAKRAAGKVFVMVNGTTKGLRSAYWNGSVFGRVELPTLGKMSQTKLLSILVVFDIDEEPKENCGRKAGSLIHLIADAKKYGISNIECIDKPEMVNSILCAKYPGAQQCQPVVHVKWRSRKWKIIFIATIALCVVVVLTAIGITFYKKHRSKQLKFRKFSVEMDQST